jgi:hypothetical protein
MRTLLQRYVDSLLDAPLALELDQPLGAEAPSEDDKNSLWQRFWISLTGSTLPPRRTRRTVSSKRSSLPIRSSGKLAPKATIRSARLGVIIAVAAIICAASIKLYVQSYGAHVARAPASPTSTWPVAILVGETTNHTWTPVFVSPDSRVTLTVIPYGTRIQVACFTPNKSGLASINAFYLIKTAPWSGFYAAANAFANGASPGEPSRPIDPLVPRCP